MPSDYLHYDEAFSYGGSNCIKENKGNNILTLLLFSMIYKSTADERKSLLWPAQMEEGSGVGGGSDERNLVFFGDRKI